MRADELICIVDGLYSEIVLPNETKSKGTQQSRLYIDILSQIEQISRDPENRGLSHVERSSRGGSSLQPRALACLVPCDSEMASLLKSLITFSPSLVPAETRGVGVLVLLSRAVLEGQGPSLQHKSAGHKSAAWCHATASWLPSPNLSLISLLFLLTGA